MSPAIYRSYVAIGDSLSEGLGDFTFEAQREHNGWTDRLAALLSSQAESHGTDFYYANLALRGSKLRKILTEQLEAALRLQPDLVTIMAGSNDFMASDADLAELEQLYRDGLQLLMAAGCDVLMANTIRPSHLKVFKKVLPKASRISQMIERVALELGVQIIDVHGVESFSDLRYWAEDMVHFSGHGHIKIANQAAAILGLANRMAEAELHEMVPPPRGPIATARWVVVYVIPFIERRLRGTSSGDGMSSKHLSLVPYSSQAFSEVLSPSASYARAA
jgi:lysophospholipase L1-like esterase